jgi:hypothetical protein
MSQELYSIASAVELAFLQHAQQLGLRCAVQVAHFVQENSGTIGQFEIAAAHSGGAGEGAFFVAEQFAFEQFGWG